MDTLAQLYLPGALALWCAVLFALASIWGYSLALRGDGASLPFARRAYGLFATAIVTASLLLALLLILRDFRIEYVQQYSGLELPIHYQFAAFWAGQKGSFLIWLLWGTLLGLLLRRTAGRSEPSVMGLYVLTLLGLLFILVRESPFVMLRDSPLDGAGLNPLLQDDWMVIHPPIMFVGYAASAIPFAFAMASLWRRDYDGWAARAFPWALGGFLVLGCAILMGGYWAYKTLGWGGFWGWDPVENASLIPWIFGTALIHGLHMERTRGRYRRANYLLAALVYLAVLYGTFLTRSGVLADFSVHSFVDLGISGWLVALMGGFFALSLYLLATRLRHVPTERNEDPALSRGTFMVLATITLLVAAAVITFGTSAPLLTRFMDNPGQVGPSFYNRVNLPIALLIALLLAMVPFLTWRGVSGSQLLRKLLPGAAASLAITAGAAAAGARDLLHLLFIFLAALALSTNLQKVVTKARAGGLRSAGGYLAHVGVGVMLLGFLASAGYDRSTKVTLEQGVPKRVDGMTLTFQRFVPRSAEDRKEKMEIKVVRENGSSYLAYPRLFLNDRTKQVMANPHIRSLALQDLYISPIEFDPGQPQLELARGESGRLAGLELRFVDFDLNAEGNALAAMQAMKSMTVGAVVEVTRDGRTERVRPLYRMDPASGTVETPPAPLPGGGNLFLAGINASAHKVQLEVQGLSNPARLAVDVTRKPLIQLVWYGLYVVLAGGALATVNRLRESFARERLAASDA
ncbi:MAG TPA: cytochrome c-type biogenesis CcmF C-terminal domain-containing protein [Thermoanaerobaculia bacterium]|nr:cytochrome c-type biogenesis CcmF C-terminal domain-containing protein [Thermoanaerobaculia bacterium]